MAKKTAKKIEKDRNDLIRGRLQTKLAGVGELDGKSFETLQNDLKTLNDAYPIKRTDLLPPGYVGKIKELKKKIHELNVRDVENIIQFPNTFEYACNSTIETIPHDCRASLEKAKRTFYLSLASVRFYPAKAETYRAAAKAAAADALAKLSEAMGSPSEGFAAVRDVALAEGADTSAAEAAALVAAQNEVEATMAAIENAYKSKAAFRADFMTIVAFSTFNKVRQNGGNIQEHLAVFKAAVASSLANSASDVASAAAFTAFGAAAKAGVVPVAAVPVAAVPAPTSSFLLTLAASVARARAGARAGAAVPPPVPAAARTGAAVPPPVPAASEDRDTKMAGIMGSPSMDALLRLQASLRTRGHANASRAVSTLHVNLRTALETWVKDGNNTGLQSACDNAFAAAGKSTLRNFRGVAGVFKNIWNTITHYIPAIQFKKPRSMETVGEIKGAIHQLVWQQQVNTGKDAVKKGGDEEDGADKDPAGTGFRR